MPKGSPESQPVAQPQVSKELREYFRQELLKKEAKGLPPKFYKLDRGPFKEVLTQITTKDTA